MIALNARSDLLALGDQYRRIRGELEVEAFHKFILQTRGNSLLESSKPKFDCLDCETCYDEEVNECCGCVSLDITWPNFQDMPPCDIDVCEPLSGTWLDDTFNSIREEGVLKIDSEFLNDTLADDKHSLFPRQPPNPTITLSLKKLKVCKIPVKLNAPYNYPSFPENHNRQWENVQQGRWDLISRYWGNTSSLCQSWAVGKVQPADVVWVPNNLGGYKTIRALYQSKYTLL